MYTVVYMKYLIASVALIIIFSIGAWWYYSHNTATSMSSEADVLTTEEAMRGPISILPIEHASMVLTWDATIIYVDPVGGSEAYASAPNPSLILLTDIHGDHLNIDTLTELSGDAPIVAPRAVYEQLPEALQARTHIMNNGDTYETQDLALEAIPMYNLPDQGVEIRHEKGRGNGYVLERDYFRVYIAGDTANTPEVRALENIDMAFMPMNLPYTMSVEDAADAVLAFEPDRVFPYHYRGPDGLSDVERFKELVEAGSDKTIVRLLDWYPAQ